MIKIQHTVIRTDSPVDAWQPNISSPFCAYKHKHATSWNAGHILSGKFITSIMPADCNTRANVLAWLECMERDVPDAVLECHAFEPPAEALAVIKEWADG